MEHELKTWPGPFRGIADGSKRFEMRRDDRGFQVGDWLLLREWAPETKEYTGAALRVKVSWILYAGTFPGLEEGYVIMSLSHPGTVTVPKCATWDLVGGDLVPMMSDGEHWHQVPPVPREED